jgi:hypothetical protein
MRTKPLDVHEKFELPLDGKVFKNFCRIIIFTGEIINDEVINDISSRQIIKDFRRETFSSSNFLPL